MEIRSVYADLPDSARYAGFWIRVFANVLDVLLLEAVNMALALAVGGVESGAGRLDPRLALFAVVFPPVAIIGSWIALGASPGKLMLRLRIVDEPTGGRPTAWQCIGRYLMALVSILCAGLGFFWIVIDPRKQGWHDKIVRTLVVRDRPR